MHASKETARGARKQAGQALELLAGDSSEAEKEECVSKLLRDVLKFVDVAERKLPSEAAYKRDAERRRQAALPANQDLVIG